MCWVYLLATVGRVWTIGRSGSAENRSWTVSVSSMNVSSDAGGDQTSLQQPLVAHRPALSRQIIKELPASLQPAISVADVLQETLILAVRDFDLLRTPSRDSFAAWLSAIAAYRIQDTVKAAGRQKRRAPRPPSKTTDDHAADSSILDLVQLVSDAPGQRWSKREVLQRWARLFPPRGPDRQPVRSIDQWIQSKLSDHKFVNNARKRLVDLGWFMKSLKEPLARQANQEDGTHGAFWAARYKSIAILDEEALLATCGSSTAIRLRRAVPNSRAGAVHVPGGAAGVVSAAGAPGRPAGGPRWLGP